MGLKKLFKKVRKAVGLPALTLGTAAKLGAVIGTGGVGAAGLALGTAAIKSKLKSAGIGAIKQAIKSKSQKAVLARARSLAPPKVVDIKSASAMPGGAPIRKVRVAAVRRVAASKPKPKKKTRKASGAKRAAPKGGKDFKALSASWKAAGKPGTWLDWVKSH